MGKLEDKRTVAVSIKGDRKLYLTYIKLKLRMSIIKLKIAFIFVKAYILNIKKISKEFYRMIRNMSRLSLIEFRLRIQILELKIRRKLFVLKNKWLTN